MEVLILRQKITIDTLRRAFNNYKRESNRKTSSFDKNNLERIESWAAAFRSVHLEILEKVCKPEDANHSYFTGDVPTFDEILLDYKSMVEESMAPQRPKVKHAAHEKSSERAPEVKLPRIPLPSFSGNYAHWLSFRDLFLSLVHNRTSLTKVEKLHYLKANLSGEAEGLLKSISVTETNYDIAWNLLNERYDNRHALLSAQLDTLFSLGNATESAVSVKNLLDRTTEAVQAIEAMHIEHLWQAVLMHITSHRLPKDTRQMWEHRLASMTNPTFNDLKKFLEVRFRALEATDTSRIKQTNAVTNRNVRSFHAEAQPICVECKASHLLRNCPSFTSMQHNQRFEVVKRHGLCLSCLARGHLVGSCPSKSRCLKCKKSHHTLLHRTPDDEVTLNVSRQIRSPFDDGPNLNALNAVIPKEVFLATALVKLESPQGSITLRALLDQGSQAFFITESAQQQLRLKGTKAGANVFGIGSSSSMVAKALVRPTLRTRDDDSITFDAFVLSKITKLNATQTNISPIWHELENLELADPHFDRPGKIDLLLGVDVYSLILLAEIRRLSFGPIVQNTRLGWVLYGPICQPHPTTEIRSFQVEISNDEVSDQLRRFWELEEIHTERRPTEEEVLCEQFYVENVSRVNTGHYVTRLPFKSEAHKTQLGASRNIAMASLRSLERRFERDPEFHAKYTACMQEFVDKGYMKRADDSVDVIRLPNGTTECKAIKRTTPFIRRPIFVLLSTHLGKLRLELP